MFKKINTWKSKTL